MPIHAPAESYLDLPDGRVRLFRAGQGEPLPFLHAAGGGGWLDYHQRLAASTHEQTTRSTELFASEVIPVLRPLGVAADA